MREDIGMGIRMSLGRKYSKQWPVNMICGWGLG